MLLAIDIGNSNITVGLFKKDDVNSAPDITWRLATDTSKITDDYSIAINQLMIHKGVDICDISAISICSVVPPLTTVFVELCERFFSIKPLVVTSEMNTGINILYDNPSDVGTDRIVDSAAALRLYGGPVVIVDMGTAIVFDAITKNGDYLGGAIAPGIAIAADALFHSTSQLRRVELVAPRTAIGTNTVHAIQSGLMLGYSDLIKGMVKRFEAELGGNAKIIGTGGLSRIMATEVKIFDIVNIDLTLQGLHLIYNFNS